MIFIWLKIVNHLRNPALGRLLWKLHLYVAKILRCYETRRKISGNGISSCHIEYDWAASFKYYTRYSRARKMNWAGRITLSHLWQCKKLKSAESCTESRNLFWSCIQRVNSQRSRFDSIPFRANFPVNVCGKRKGRGFPTDVINRSDYGWSGCWCELAESI